MQNDFDAVPELAMMMTAHGSSLLVLSAALGPKKAIEMVKRGVTEHDMRKHAEHWCKQMGVVMRDLSYKQQLREAEFEREAKRDH